MDAKEIREKAIKEAKSNIILDAALQVFADKGFHDTRLEDIAAVAGFSKASLYNYYESKEVLFMNLSVREFNRLFEKHEEILNRSISFVDKMREVLRATFNFFGNHFAIILAISNFQALSAINIDTFQKHHDMLFGKFKRSVRCIFDLYYNFYEKARNDGAFDSPLASDVIAKYFGGLVRGVLLEWKLSGTMGNIEQEVEQLTTFFCQGISCCQN